VLQVPEWHENRGKSRKDGLFTMSDNLQQQLQLVVQSNEIATIVIGGVPVLELPKGEMGGEHVRSFIRAINFLRAGCEAVQLVSFCTNSYDIQLWNKMKTTISDIVQSLEIREGLNAESLKCEFDDKKCVLTVTRSVPPAQ
jgi:hypothetical protein